MFRFPMMAAAKFALGAGVLLAGCESSSTSADASRRTGSAQHQDMSMSRGGSTTQPSAGDMKMSAGVTCDKCRVTYVRVPYTVPGYEGPRVVGYRSAKATECPDCRKHAMQYFSTGKLQRECKECGGTLDMAEPQPAE